MLQFAEQQVRPHDAAYVETELAHFGIVRVLDFSVKVIRHKV